MRACVNSWPWTEGTEDRLRRIIESYRLTLMECDPAMCRALDEQMTQFGQGWISSTELIGNDELKTAQELADLYGLKPFNVHDWSRRHPNLLPKKGKAAGKTLYRVGDFLVVRREMKNKGN